MRRNNKKSSSKTGLFRVNINAGKTAGTSYLLGRSSDGRYCSTNARPKRTRKSYKRADSQQVKVRKFMAVCGVAFLIGCWSGISEANKAQPQQPTQQEQTQEQEAEPASILPSLEDRDTTAREYRAKTIQEIGQEKVTNVFGADEWLAFDKLEKKEAGWIVGNKNPFSGACGLGQFCPCSKMAKYGGTLGDGESELQAMINYISERYQKPSIAWDFWLNKSWKVNPNKACRKAIDKCRWY